MYKIATLNKISPVGLGRLTNDYEITENISEACGILVRSQDMLEMEFSPSLLGIARAGAGVNNIPLTRCAEEGIVVFNTPGANANAVKELVLCAMLADARNLYDAMHWTNKLSKSGGGDLGISKSVEKGKGQFAGHELLGKTIGVIGLGAIGVKVANACEALGMKVLGYDPFITAKSAHMLSADIPYSSDLNAIVAQCDYITIHVPASPKTNGLISKEVISNMKEGAVLLNFSRDKLVDEAAVLAALETGALTRYITDFPNDTTIGQPGVMYIPHLGASTEEAEENSASLAVDELMDYIENGNIENSVNYPRCSLGKFVTGQGRSRICILNKNVAGVLGDITGVLAKMNINIANMINSNAGDFAYTMIDTDTEVDATSLTSQMSMAGIIRVRVIK
ncbi:MAG: 3-phosphoglycerate dehydrogenase [Firmicutes bacterium]|nr:3-phosphoglycerate dehydrogenase [Bacillota bacterium]